MNKPIATLTLCNRCSIVVDEIDNKEDRLHLYTIDIDGNCVDFEWCDIDYTTEEPSIVYCGERYDLSQFVKIDLF